MSSRMLFALLVLVVALERLVELRIASRNRLAALAAGGVEFGNPHYRVMKVLHTAFLLAALAEVWLLHRPFIPWLGWPMLVLVAAAMILRYWVIGTLGERWNTRIIVVDSWEPAVEGPYRYIRHPNYVAVVVELFALPMVHTAWVTAVVFSVCNIALLVTRIRTEDAALARWHGYPEALGGHRRFVPAHVGFRRDETRGDVPG
jgi:methyltransferase